MPNVIDPMQHRVTPEEIAKLWMSENAVVNQKTSYFVAANAFLVSAICLVLKSGPSDPLAAYVLAFCGLAFSLLTLSSVGRTCAYRDHLIGMLKERSHDYSKILSPNTFPWYSKVTSSFVLQTLPTVSLILWFVAIIFLYAQSLKT
jgi:hypothetical protein